MTKFVESKEVDEDELDEFEEDTKQSGSNETIEKIKDFYYEHKLAIIIVGGLLLLFLIIAIVNNMNSGGGSKSNIYISMNKKKVEEVTVTVNTEFSLDLKGTNSSVSDVKWVSEAPDIVLPIITDGLTGKMKAVSFGESKLTVNYTIGGETKELECNVTVANGKEGVKITNVSFTEGALVMTTGREYVLMPQILPSDGFIENEQFMSSNPNIATVDSITGNVKAISEGETSISIIVNNNFSATKSVYVTNDIIESGIYIIPEKFIFKESSMEVTVGETKDLQFTISPQNATTAAVIWKSSNTDVAIVSDGKVKGMKEGEAVITAKVGSLKAEINVKVKPDVVPVNAIIITNGTNVSLTQGNTYTISYTVEPSSVTNKDVTFDSSAPSVAVADTSGVVTAVGEGTCTITVTSVSTPTVSASISVTVAQTSGGSSSSGDSGSSSSSSSDSSSSSSSSSYGEIKFKSSTGNAISTESEAKNNPFTDSDVTFTLTYSKTLGENEAIKYCIFDNTKASTCTPSKKYNLSDEEKVSMSEADYAGHVSGVLVAVYDKDDKIVESTRKTRYFYFNGTATTTTTGCPAGKGKDTSATTGCSYCAAGYYSPDNDDKCHPCNGTNQYSGVGASTCKVCGSGQKANDDHTGCVSTTSTKYCYCKIGGSCSWRESRDYTYYPTLYQYLSTEAKCNEFSRNGTAGCFKENGYYIWSNDPSMKTFISGVSTPSACEAKNSDSSQTPTTKVCSAGEYPIGSNCDACGKGYYCPDGTNRYPCGSGYTTSGTRSTKSSDCFKSSLDIKFEDETTYCYSKLSISSKDAIKDALERYANGNNTITTNTALIVCDKKVKKIENIDGIYRSNIICYFKTVDGYTSTSVKCKKISELAK